MSNALVPIITEAGLQALFHASNKGVSGLFSHVALGNSGYIVEVNSNGHATQTSLKNEQQRVAIADGQRVTAQQIDVSFVADGDQEYWICELGFYLEDGTLFAVWSDPNNALAWKARDVPLIIGLELVLTTLPDDAVTVESGSVPLQLLMTGEMASVGTAIANLQYRQLQQADEILELAIADDLEDASLFNSALPPFPAPDPNGMDLYLPVVLNQHGWQYDHSHVGHIIAKSTTTVEPGELLADGSAYFTDQKSDDGIPYKRLQQKYWDPQTQTCLYGTGKDNMTAYSPGIDGIASLLLVANSSGTADPAIDGDVATGFDFVTPYTSDSDISLAINAWIMKPGTIYLQAKSNDIVNTLDTGTSGVSLSIVADTPSTPMECEVIFSTGEQLANSDEQGKYWIINTIEDSYVIWYCTGDELEPEIDDGKLIKVNISIDDSAALVAEKTTVALNNLNTSIITICDASNITPGCYFKFSIPTENFYIWYSIDGIGTDPKISEYTPIKVSLRHLDDASEVASKTQAAINSRRFAVPDYRGLFLRGVMFDYDSNQLSNPEKRFSKTNLKHSATTQGNVGSEELSCNRAHKHDSNSSASSVSTSDSQSKSILELHGRREVLGFDRGRPGDTRGIGNTHAWSYISINKNSVSTTTTTNTTTETTVDIDINEHGHNESRPSNIGVMYVVKY